MKNSSDKYTAKNVPLGARDSTGLGNKVRIPCSPANPWCNDKVGGGVLGPVPVQ
ncbi:MAG: hypothetical protein WC712_12355 [Candidatus Brocadiia bacterium]